MNTSQNNQTISQNFKQTSPGLPDARALSQQHENILTLTRERVCSVQTTEKESSVKSHDFLETDHLTFAIERFLQKN